jgi:hypothetical protein
VGLPVGRWGNGWTAPQRPVLVGTALVLLPVEQGDEIVGVVRVR